MNRLPFVFGQPPATPLPTLNLAKYPGLKGWFTRLVDLYEASLRFMFWCGYTQGFICGFLLCLIVVVGLQYLRRMRERKCVIEF